MTCTCQPCFRCHCADRNLRTQYSIIPTVLLTAAMTAAAIGMIQRNTAPATPVKNQKCVSKKLEVIPIGADQPVEPAADKGVPVIPDAEKKAAKK